MSDVNENKEGMIEDKALPDEPSVFLTESMDIIENVEETDLKSLLQQAEEIKETKLAEEQKAIGDMPLIENRCDIFTEITLYSISEEIFALYMKRAREFVKKFCKAYNLQQKWTRSKKLGKVNYKYTNVYVPSRYQLTLLDKDTKDIKLVSEVRDTADEAAESVAIMPEIGFLKSLEHLSIFKSQNEIAVGLILQDRDKYLGRVREIARLEELKVQILCDNNSSIATKLKYAWIDEINAKISRMHSQI